MKRRAVQLGVDGTRERRMYLDTVLKAVQLDGRIVSIPGSLRGTRMKLTSQHELAI